MGISQKLTPATVIILFSSLLLYNNGNCDEIPTNPNKTVDYAKLELNKEELLGSRWAIEQARNEEKVTIYHAFQIVDVVKVDVNDMSIRIDFNVRQRWDANGMELPDGLFKPHDTNGTFISAEESILDSVWSPDSYIPNARDAKILSVTTRLSAVQIYKTNTIIYKARMYVVLACSFTFQWYPLDIQVCDFVFESYKYTSQSVNYEWEPDNPITAADGIILYQYEFALPPKRFQGLNQYGRFSYPYLKMTFKFERRLGNNILQIFIPTILVVTLSFFSFWLGLDAIPGRISLLVTCILTLVTMHSGLKGVIPTVHYVKMMDIWMIGCMVFVFGAICETIIVRYIKWRKEQLDMETADQEKLLEDMGLNKPFQFPITKHFNGSQYLENPNYMGPRHNNNMMQNLPGALPPAYEQHPYVQNSRTHTKDQDQHVSYSAQKREAWREVQQRTVDMPPRMNMYGMNEGYPGGMQMAGMYNPHLNIPPLKVPRPIWVQVDRVCRGLFPGLFAIFNFVFWPILLVESAKQHQFL